MHIRFAALTVIAAAAALTACSHDSTPTVAAPAVTAASTTQTAPAAAPASTTTTATAAIPAPAGSRYTAAEIADTCQTLRQWQDNHAQLTGTKPTLAATVDEFMDSVVKAAGDQPLTPEQLASTRDRLNQAAATGC